MKKYLFKITIISLIFLSSCEDNPNPNYDPQKDYEQIQHNQNLIVQLSNRVDSIKKAIDSLDLIKEITKNDLQRITFQYNKLIENCKELIMEYKKPISERKLDVIIERQKELEIKRNNLDSFSGTFLEIARECQKTKELQIYDSKKNKEQVDDLNKKIELIQKSHQKDRENYTNESSVNKDKISKLNIENITLNRKVDSVNLRNIHLTKVLEEIPVLERKIKNVDILNEDMSETFRLKEGCYKSKAVYFVRVQVGVDIKRNSPAKRFDTIFIAYTFMPDKIKGKIQSPKIINEQREQYIFSNGKSIRYSKMMIIIPGTTSTYIFNIGKEKLSPGNHSIQIFYREQIEEKDFNNIYKFCTFKPLF